MTEKKKHVAMPMEQDNPDTSDWETQSPDDFNSQVPDSMKPTQIIIQSAGPELMKQLKDMEREMKEKMNPAQRERRIQKDKRAARVKEVLHGTDPIQEFGYHAIGSEEE